MCESANYATSCAYQNNMNNTNDKVILFTHHSQNDITKHHFELVKKHNPNIPVIPVGFEHHQLLEGSHIVRKTSEYPDNDQLNTILQTGNSSESDLYIYDFFIHNQDYKSYIVIEWDTYCNASIEDCYGEAMDKYDTFSALSFTNIPDHPDTVHTQKRYVTEWSWYHYFQLLKSPAEQKKLMPYLGGTYPTSLLFYKHHVLHNMVSYLLSDPRLYDNIQNEMRLGTLIQQAGYKIVEYGQHTNQFFEQPHYQTDIANNIKGYYHPIKTIL